MRECRKRIIKTANTIVLAVLAAEEGFEPSQNESESLVLPLHYSAMLLVRGTRLELARCRHRRILSPLRLPVPPSRQSHAVTARTCPYFPKRGQKSSAACGRRGVRQSFDLSSDSSRTAPSTRALPSQPMRVKLSCQNSQTQRVLSTGSR